MRKNIRLNPFRSDRLLPSRLLRFLDCFTPLFHIAGVDYRVLRQIVHIKLIRDDHRPHIGKDDKQWSNALAKALIFNSLLGIFIGSIIARVTDRILALIIVFSIIIRWLAPGFIRKRSQLGVERSKINSLTKGGFFADALTKLSNHSSEERAAFF